VEVILRQNVKEIGRAGEKVKVADGFARNFLIPKGLAVPATHKNMDLVEREHDLEQLRKSKDLRKAQELSQKIRKISCTIVKQVSEGEKLFGSVTAQDVAKSLENEGIFLDKKQVILDEPIKSLGIYPVKIRLAPEIESVLKVWVVK
jgi:large subunit ribosomal protein L9